MRFQQPTRRVHRLQPLAQLVLDAFHRLQKLLARGDVVGLGIDRVARQLAQHLAGQRIEQAQRFDLIIEQFHAQRVLIGFSRMNVDDLTAYPKRTARQFQVIAGVLQIGKPAQNGALIDLLTAHQMQDHLHVPFGIAQTVDRGNGSDNDRIRPLQNRLGRRQAHLLDVLVDRGVLLDVGIGRWNVGFRLVVVVVGDEILHRVVREELLHLAIQLRGQSLVRRQQQGRALHGSNDIGDGIGLAAAGDAQQGLMRQPITQAVDQIANGCGLITGGLKAGAEGEGLECLHGSLAGRKISVLSDIPCNPSVQPTFYPLFNLLAAWPLSRSPP